MKHAIYEPEKGNIELRRVATTLRLLSEKFARPGCREGSRCDWSQEWFAPRRVCDQTHMKRRHRRIALRRPRIGWRTPNRRVDLLQNRCLPPGYGVFIRREPEGAGLVAKLALVLLPGSAGAAGAKKNDSAAPVW
jgi:hypothetical protein